jgi:hypothetical protein
VRLIAPDAAGRDIDKRVTGGVEAGLTAGTRPEWCLLLFPSTEPEPRGEGPRTDRAGRATGVKAGSWVHDR